MAQPVLIETIITMVLISIQPFACRKILLLVATLLCLSSAICFADSLFMSLHPTPHGPDLTRSQRAPSCQTDVSLASQNDGLKRDSEELVTAVFVLDPTIGPAGIQDLGYRSLLSTKADSSNTTRPSTQGIDGSPDAPGIVHPVVGRRVAWLDWRYRRNGGRRNRRASPTRCRAPQGEVLRLRKADFPMVWARKSSP
jgi:hypothetical protein